MMKHIFFILALAASICSTAQVYQFSTTSKEDMDKFLKEHPEIQQMQQTMGKFTGQTQTHDSPATSRDKFSNVLNALTLIPADRLTGSGSEQGQDRLDSIYYLHTKTYEIPYASKKDKIFADNIIRQFIQAYDLDLPKCKGGYCYTSTLQPGGSAQSKQVEMYYAEGLKPHVVGGKDHNYIVLRDNDATSPYYRTAIGIEWWLNQDKNQTLSLQTFKLRGALNYELYLKALQENTQKKYGNNWWKKSEAAADIFNTTTTEGFLSTKEGLLQAIATFAKFYTDKDETLNRAVVKSINERIVTYLTTPDKTPEDYVKLYRTLAHIPGYEVKVTFTDGEIINQGDFGWFESISNSLDIFCTTWSQQGDPECVKVIKHNFYEEKKPLNFLYQVVVTNDKGVKIGK